MHSGRVRIVSSTKELETEYLSGKNVDEVLEMAISRSLDRNEKKGFGCVYILIRLIWLI